MSCTWRWCENHAAQIYCISRIWVHHVYSQSKRNCCAKDWVRALSSMSDQNQVDNKSYCWAPTMVPHCFYGTKVKVTFICGTPRHCSSHRTSSKCRKAAIADCRHKSLPATNGTCGQSKVISTILSQIKSVAMVRPLLFIPLLRNATTDSCSNGTYRSIDRRELVF